MPRTIISRQFNTYTLNFNGSNQYVTLTADGPFSGELTAFTLEAIVTPLLKNSISSIVSNTSASSQHIYWQLNADRTFGNAVYTNGTPGVLSGVSTLNIAQTYMLHLVYTGSSLIQYINAVQDKSVTCTGTVSATALSSFGRGLAATRYLRGSISCVRFWDRDLSLSEVQDRYFSDLYTASVVSGMQSSWNIEEGSGSTIADSISGDTGTITGATWSASEAFGSRDSSTGRPAGERVSSSSGRVLIT